MPPYAKHTPFTPIIHALISNLSTMQNSVNIVLHRVKYTHSVIIHYLCITSSHERLNLTPYTMQFSKRVSELARLHGIEQKDVLFAMLATAGASTAEAFAVIYRPTVSTSAALSTKASNYIGQRPGLKRLIKQLDEERATPTDNEQPAKRRGRPRKEDSRNVEAETDPDVVKEYLNKDSIIGKLVAIAERCEKESDKLAAIREISALQRMKQEAAVEDEKRVQFYIPLSYERAEELTNYLARYYAERDGITAN